MEEKTMLKRICAVALAGMMINLVCFSAPALAKSTGEKQARIENEVRTGILRLGVGTHTRIAVKLRDNTKLAGYITESSHDSFVLKDVKTGTSRTVPYGDVVQAKGHNISTGAKIAIGVGIGVGLTLLVLYLIFVNYQD